MTVPRRSSHRPQAGFALLQMMIALAILASLSIMMWGAVQQTSRTKQANEHLMERYQAGRNAVTRLAKDLSMAYLSNNTLPGQEETPRTLFFASHPGDIDEVHFSYFGHLRFYEDFPEADTALVSYLGRSGTQFGTNKPTLQLIRRETRRIQPTPVSSIASIPGETDVLCEGVVRLEITYYDPRPEVHAWLDRWDSTQASAQLGRLPSRVRIRLVVLDEKGQELTFFTETRLPMYQIVDTSPK